MAITTVDLAIAGMKPPEYYAKAVTGTLVAGTVTINNTNISAADRIMITRSALNGTPALGFLSYTISAGASFTVASFSTTGTAVVTDVSSFTYVIIRQS